MAKYGKKLKADKVDNHLDKDLLESYSPRRVAKILPTNCKVPENAFEKFRPNPEDHLDYNISETVVRMDCGCTKINIKQTTADYVPIPLRKPRKITLSHVGKARLKFIDEIRREKQKKLQEQHLENFNKFVERRKHFDKHKAQNMHNELISMVGPGWYQELSPQQLSLVDSLEYYVCRDYLENTIVNTRDFVGSLGLVPRPNKNLVRKALQLCLANPVQFLLILYQLLDPQRKSYSINDRLLLSAVVHLTMQDTLLELHIRIPSPPRTVENEKIIKRRPKRKIHESPYLEPFDFKPERTSPIGDFRKTHMQCPESPYFAYVEALHTRINIENAEDAVPEDKSYLNEEDRDIQEDMEKAQNVYNNLHKTKIKLLKPKYYCHISTDDTKKLCLPSLAKLDDRDSICECRQIEEELGCYPALGFNCECREQCDCIEKSKQLICYLCTKCRHNSQHKNARHIINGTKITESNSVIPIIGGTFVEKRCYCLTNYKNKLLANNAKCVIESQKVKYFIGGMVMSRVGPVYFMSTALSNKRVNQMINSQNILPEKLSIPTSNNKHIEDNGEGEKHELNKILTCVCDMGENTTNSDSSNKQDIMKNDDKETSESFKCLAQTTSSSSNTCPEENDECKCKEELDIFLKHQCTCEKCNVEKRRLNATYIMSGVMNVEDNDPVNIISGIQERRCDCLKNYLDKLEKLEDYKRRTEARIKLRLQTKKYVIGGVCSTPAGIQYLLTGMRPSVKCICAETLLEEQKTKEAERHMAKLPDTGRIKYAITGVQGGVEQNTFILSNALPVGKCSCEKIYDAFVESHKNCLDYYDQFMETIAEEELNYKDEFKTNPDYDVENFEPDVELEYFGEGEVDIPPEEFIEICDHTTTDEDRTDNKEEHNNSLKTDTCFLTDSHEDRLSSDNQKMDRCTCTCQGSAESLKFDPKYAIKLTEADILKSHYTEQYELKRFVILEKFSCQWCKWKNVVKKVLHSMAEDGFPLARLPECYKLPHFKLWMHLRCKKCYTPKEVADMNNSLHLWVHTNACYKETKIPNLSICPKMANSLTWRHARFCKKLLSDKYREFYRNLKKQRIDSAREFFPTTFSYDFYNKNFRNCFFAYLPSKEEDIFVEALRHK